MTIWEFTYSLQKQMEETLNKPLQANVMGREALLQWQADLRKNIYLEDFDLIHSIHQAFPQKFSALNGDLEKFGAMVPTTLEVLVQENHFALNLPRIETYSAMGVVQERIVHHPTYVLAGDIIYSTELLAKTAIPGGLLEGLCFLFLSSQVGEGGHHCPIACSAGMIRLLQKTADFTEKADFLEGLLRPSFTENFTGAQFLTEVQGGSDVGLNATYAEHVEGKYWRIYGEKWFCSNANADLIFLTARFLHDTEGTKGLGLFLVPAKWQGEPNHYHFRRLKDKMGTRTMATAEIDFLGAHAIPIAVGDGGFQAVMENVLHISRIFNIFSVLGMARRAYFIARNYAKHRVAFQHVINTYPLVQEGLARMRAENTAMLAGIFATTQLQDGADRENANKKEDALLLRLLVNMQKSLSAKWSVDHIHHALDVLAGNGTIISFSALPRLLQDCIVCENWEGTHNTLHMQILKDIHKYAIDTLFVSHMEEKILYINSKDKLFLPIKTFFDLLKKEILGFRALSNALQTLQIPILIQKMAVLYCAVCLYDEALDQMKTRSLQTKLDCYQLFCILHINNEAFTPNEDYLDLIKRLL